MDKLQKIQLKRTERNVTFCNLNYKISRKNILSRMYVNVPVHVIFV